MARVSKERQAKTLETMRENRKADTMFLRNIIDKKLQWAIAEYKKGQEVIERQLQQVKENQTILLKLSAVISALKELLETKKDETQSEENKE